MRRLRLAAAAMLLELFLGGAAWAQVVERPTTSALATTMDLDSYLSAPTPAPPGVPRASPSDRPVAPLAAPPAAAGGSGEPKEVAAEEEAEQERDEPRRLIGDMGWGVDVSGWLDMGITGNPSAPRSRYNGVLAPNDRNEFQVNQTYLVMERALKSDEDGWDIGGRVDLLYGTDWIYGASLGLETHPDGSSRWNSHIHYGLAMPQAYGEVAVGDLSLKLGHFYTIIGYESLMAPNNFFYSMNYALRYAEPTAHTGGLFTWNPSDELTLTLGGVNGQDRFDGQSDTLAVLTGFAYAPEHEKYSLAFGIMTGGNEDGLLPVEGPRTYFSTVFVWNPSEKLKSVTQYDSGWQENFDLRGNHAEFYSITQYVFYTINDCWAAGLRYDWFRDDDGTRLGGLRFGGLPGGNPLPLPSGNAGAVQAISLGVNYAPNANVRLRPEVRWDWFGGEGPPLFDDRTRNSQFTVAADLIVKF